MLPGFRLERVRRQVGAPVFPILARDTARTAPFAAATTVKNAPKKTLYQFRGSESEVCPQKAAAVPVPAVPAVQNPWSVPTVSRYRDRPVPRPARASKNRGLSLSCNGPRTVHAGKIRGLSPRFLSPRFPANATGQQKPWSVPVVHRSTHGSRRDRPRILPHFRARHGLKGGVRSRQSGEKRSRKAPPTVPGFRICGLSPESCVPRKLPGFCSLRGNMPSVGP